MGKTSKSVYIIYYYVKYSKKLSLVDAAKSMDTYFRLTDGILNVIKEQVEDEEVHHNIV